MSHGAVLVLLAPKAKAGYIAAFNALFRLLLNDTDSSGLNCGEHLRCAFKVVPVAAFNGLV